MTRTCMGSHYTCLLIHKYFNLLQTNAILILYIWVSADPHFNVIPHLLAQCGTKPRTTTIAAGAPTCTPLWVPQRIVKVPLASFKWSCVPRFRQVDREGLALLAYQDVQGYKDKILWRQGKIALQLLQQTRLWSRQELALSANCHW